LKKKIISALMTFLITLFSLSAVVGPASADTYSSYSALKSRNTINEDYRIVSRDTASSTAVIAIHGGVIESETDEIASAVASKGGYDYYGFLGLRSGLHITSTNFDEPIARRLVAKSTKTLSIHGCTGTSQITYLGGLDKTTGQKVKTALQAAGFRVSTAPSRLAGTARTNICNSNTINKGVQLELTKSMRNYLGSNSTAFNRYTTALANAID